MPTVTCPSCGEKGKIPGHFVGTRIKCKKCGVAFLVSAPTATKTPASAPALATAPAPAGAGSNRDSNEISVEGLDDSAWSASPVATVDHDHEHGSDGEQDHPDEANAAFTAHHPETAPHASTAPNKEYKVVSSKDKCFEGKFDLPRLEATLNLLARQGWVVKGMSTPHLASFQGEREELVIILER